MLDLDGERKRKLTCCDGLTISSGGNGVSPLGKFGEAAAKEYIGWTRKDVKTSPIVTNRIDNFRRGERKTLGIAESLLLSCLPGPRTSAISIVLERDGKVNDP